MTAPQELASTHVSGATVDDVLHELAELFGYDTEGVITYAAFADLAERHGVDVVTHFTHCIAGHPWDACTCDAELDRRRGK